MLIAFDISKIAASGPGWNALVADAAKVTSGMGLGNAVGEMTDQTTVWMYARALKAAKTNNQGDRQVVVDLLNKFPSASLNAPQGSLGPSRNVAAIALSADLVNHKPPTLLNWLKMVIRRDMGGRSIISTHNDRPNNWGTHAGASRMAVSLLAGDTAEMANAVKTFKGYLGDRDAYASFKYGNPAWQVPPPRPVNPKGATKSIDGGMRNVDGVLVDDQRRQGDSGHYSPGRYATWPPAKENYPWEAMQGVVLQAELCFGAGHSDVYDWQDKAILRAVQWLYDQAKNPASGDDTFIPWVINLRYQQRFPAATPSGEGKGWGYTDWSHQAVTTTPAPEPEPEPEPSPCAAVEAELVLTRRALSAAEAARDLAQEDLAAAKQHAAAIVAL